MRICGLQTDARFLYFSSRIIALVLFILSTLAWAFYGYDSTTAAIFTPELNGLGLHFSTLQTMAATFYILIVNLQSGGLTLRKFRNELVIDLKTLFTFRIVQGRKASLDRIVWADIPPFQALLFASLGPLLALFLFELPYASLLNYYHFNDLMWPIYGMGIDGIIQPILYRNIAFFTIPLFFCLLWFPWLYQVKLKWTHRFDAMLPILFVGFFIIWVTAPSNIDQAFMLGSAEFPPDTIRAVLPAVEQGFPQNVYFYFAYNSTGREVLGLHVDDPLIHTLNIVTKYLAFAWVGSILLVSRPFAPREALASLTGDSS